MSEENKQEEVITKKTAAREVVTELKLLKIASFIIIGAPFIVYVAQLQAAGTNYIAPGLALVSAVIGGVILKRTLEKLKYFAKNYEIQ